MPKHAACPDCGGELRKLSEDVSEMLEYVPESFQVIRQEGPVYGPMCWSRSTPIIFPSTGNARFMSGKESNWRDRRWRTGSAEPAHCWIRWWKRCGVM